MPYLEQFDPEIQDLLDREYIRQLNGLELIASENIVSHAVLEAMGSIFTNKYAEGYPGKRHYGGCEFHDQVENLARTRLSALFGADHVNVQPHSGSQANQAVYLSCLKPKDKILSQSLTQGGHLSHGAAGSLTESFFTVDQYGVDPESETLDYGAIEEQARKFKPQLIVCGASAYPREIDFRAFAEIAEDVGAKSMADIAHIAGLCCTGQHNSPVGVTTYTTSTTHKTLRGPRGGVILCGKEVAGNVDAAVFPGLQGGPLMHIIAAKAVCFKEALQESYTTYIKQVVKNSSVLAATLADNNIRICSGGTDNHLCLLDLTDLNITGVAAEKALGRAGITANKNTIPREKRSTFVTSGLRLGTPTITSRGMKEQEMQMIGDWVARILHNIEDRKLQDETKAEVTALCERYPIYPDTRSV